MKNQNILVSLLLIVIFSGLGFFAGTKYQSSKTPTFGRMGNRPEISGTPRRMGFNQIMGEIIAQDEKTLTIKTLDGSSKIIVLTESTLYNKSSEAAITDLKTGEKVAIFGKENQDGTVTADNINLNPALRAQTN